MTFNHRALATIRFAAAAVVVGTMQSVALAQTPAQPGAVMPGLNGSSSMPAGKMDMKAMMKDMNDKMSSMPMTGRQDVDFAMMMRIHHQGAIDMAEVEIRSGKEPKMKKMAKEIVAAQKKEIAEIDKFLATKGGLTHKMSQ